MKTQCKSHLCPHKKPQPHQESEYEKTLRQRIETFDSCKKHLRLRILARPAGYRKPQSTTFYVRPL